MLPAIDLPQVDTGPFVFGRVQQSVKQASLWQPNKDHPDGRPNPQRLAYDSKADVLGYGGAGGGGKTDLLLGLAATQHKHSVIFRRVFKNLRGIIERSREIFNPEDVDHSKDLYNEQLHRWRLSDGRIVEFEACQYEQDKFNQRGRPRDFYGFDEVTEFTRSQVEFISAWNRSTDRRQRCRVVLTFNPPTDDSGSWVIEYFKPWLAHLFPDYIQHPNPARPGELRWYATVDGEEMECESGEPFEHDGELIRPLSRTFIPAKLQDNPYLRDTNYGAIIDSLPEPLRSQLKHGDFTAAAAADPWQAIPTEWVRLAQRRWQERQRPDVPLAAAGVDPARGGRDKTAIARRYDNYFDEVATWPGRETPDGPTVALIARNEIGEAEPLLINIDVIGIGASAYDSLVTMYNSVVPINGAAGAQMRDRSGRLKMRNVRAAYYWQMREALDPEHGDDLALPPDNELLADLCAARYKNTAAGITIEEKEEIKARIGRSPDTGEAVLLANYIPEFEPVEITRMVYSPVTIGRGRRI